ncbi:MAG: flagellar basal body L-ring protein FlgH [Thermodesulfobacteriota bacterium]|nr:flagellar basal body L-ring protein FlgH [Thermodesulfobacteriota bacterium]
MKLYHTILFVGLAILMGSCAHSQIEPIIGTEALSDPVEEQTDVVKSPGSLWSPNASLINIYSDAKARKVGDIVIVQIIESASATKEAKTNAEKTNEVDSSITDLIGLPLDEATIKGRSITPSVGASTSTNFEGDADTSRKGDVSGTLPARIMRILPSDNMVISGKKQIRVNGEIQYMILSGIIRPEDISANNTISSTCVADMRLDYYGSGILADAQRRGFMSGIIDKVWPF